MKRLLFLGVCAGLCLTLLPSANGAAKKFANCTELRKIYPGGVARAGAVNKGGITRKIPTYNLALYLVNQGLDHDRDGISCEK